MQEDKQTYYEKTDAKIMRVSIASKPDLGSGRCGLLNGIYRKEWVRFKRTQRDSAGSKV